MRAYLGTIVCKFGSDRVTFVVEEAICAKFTDRQTDGRTTDASRLHKLILWNELIIAKQSFTVLVTHETYVKIVLKHDICTLSWAVVQ